MDGLYDVKWEKTGNSFKAGASSMSGTLKALFDIRDGNNGENFTGEARVIDSKHVKVVSPSITDIEAMTVPESGTLTIYGKDYNYTNFTFETDANGKITSYTFELEDALSQQQSNKVDGMQASIGSSVDTMGVPYYMSQMNQFLRSFCSLFNDIMLKGQDLDGNATDYYSFFTGADQVTGEEYVLGKSDKNHGNTTDCGASSYYKLTASNICVSSICVKDSSKLAAQYKDDIVIYKINVDNEKELASAFGIQSIPTLLFIPKTGKPQIAQGALSKEQFVEQIDNFLLKK